MAESDKTAASAATSGGGGGGDIGGGGGGIPPPNPPGTGGGGQPAPGSKSIPPNIQQMVASKRLQQAQAQVGQVVDIMRVNVEKVLERDQKLSELDRRADDLQVRCCTHINAVVCQTQSTTNN